MSSLQVVNGVQLDVFLPFKPYVFKCVPTQCHSRTAMQILTFKESLAVWRSISFLGHFLMIAIILVSIVLPPKSPKKSKPAVNDEQHYQNLDLHQS